MDPAILQALLQFKPEEDLAALATIVTTKGSTPREAGVSMLVYADGRTVGTVGGGCAEGEIKQAARMALDDGRGQMRQIDLTGDLAADEGMACGGIMDVFIEPIHTAAAFALMNELQKEQKAGYTAVVVAGEPELIGQRAVFRQDGSLLGGAAFLAALPPPWRVERARVLALADQPAGGQVLVQPLIPPVNLLILGGGHIGQALAAMAGHLDFQITVVDDRPDFANRALFPDARVICNDFSRTLAGYPINGSTYIAVITRGHRHDEACLRQILGSPAAYIGLIGSRRRTRLLLGQLAEAGYAQAVLARVKTPIGLDIGAETPGEIAVSILAEIIAARRRGRSDY